MTYQEHLARVWRCEEARYVEDIEAYRARVDKVLAVLVLAVGAVLAMLLTLA